MPAHCVTMSSFNTPSTQGYLTAMTVGVGQSCCLM